MPPTNGAPRVSFVSLGCAKNLVDSEVLLGRLAQDGFVLCGDPKDSDVVVINTCGFLQAAEQESLGVIDEVLRLKRRGHVRGVVVAGCLPQRYGPAFSERVPDVDAVLGITSREHIVEVCRSLIGDSPRGQTTQVSADLPRYEIDRDRLRLTPRHFAYVRLSEGCNHTCAFCIIPTIRGKFRSKPMEVIEDEVRELARNGAREINLIAQDTTNYGYDLYRKFCLDELLQRLHSIEGLDWIRLLYCYPTFVTDRLIDTLAELPKVVKYMDLPVQHTRERMLRLMRRGMTEEGQKKLIHKMRERIPDFVLRTTVIVGFPGEREEDFEGLLTDLEELRFDRLGTFLYSREPGTAAHALGNHISEDLKRERFKRVMGLQRQIALAKNRSWVGRQVPVLVEKKEEARRWKGRTYGDAPDIDPTITLIGNHVRIGDITLARVTGFRGYDLIGELEGGGKDSRRS